MSAGAALSLLGAAPADKDGGVRYLHSLRNDDGGFGDRPGWAVDTKTESSRVVEFRVAE